MVLPAVRITPCLKTQDLNVRAASAPILNRALPCRIDRPNRRKDLPQSPIKNALAGVFSNDSASSKGLLNIQHKAGHLRAGYL